MTLILGLDFPPYPSCSQFANTHFPLTQIDDESKFNLAFFYTQTYINEYVDIKFTCGSGIINEIFWTKGSLKLKIFLFC